VSDPTDIKALDEYLKGGSDISRALRELREDVPPELDRRVLDEARAAVASGGRSRSWLRWGAPVALAASVVLAVTVVIESGPQDDTSFMTQPAAVDKQYERRKLEEAKVQVQDAQPSQVNSQAAYAPEPPVEIVTQAAPAAAPASPLPPALARKEAELSNNVTPEEVRADAKALREESVASTPIAADSALANSPASDLAAEQPAFAGSVAARSSRQEAQRAPAEADSSDDDLSSVSVTGTRVRRAGRTAGPRGTISGSAFRSETRPAADEESERSDAQQSDPQKWLEDIRELRRTGKVVEADRAWKQFRAAFPNFPVADDDLARKQR